MAMCFGKARYVDTESNIIAFENDFLKGGYIFEDIITQKFHPPVNYLHKKCILQEFGLFRPDIIAEDFYMNCLISQKYPIGFIDDYLCYYRVERLEKKRDPLKLLLDHRTTIDLFKTEAVYRKAVLYSNLRLFYMLSCYKKYKLLSLKYLLLSLPFFYKKKFIAGSYHLFCYWW